MMGLYIPKQPSVEIAVSGSSFVQVTRCIKCNNYRKDTVTLRQLLAKLTCFHTTIYLVTGDCFCADLHTSEIGYGPSTLKTSRLSSSQCASKRPAKEDYL